MIDPTEADIGRTVIYQPHPRLEPDRGTIVSFNDTFVFVQYGHTHRDGTRTPMATYRKHLTWADED